MQPYVKAYMNSLGYDESDIILCEVCHKVSNDIHHIRPKSFFGKKERAARDHPWNLIALCRKCHEDAHSRNIRDFLTEIVNKRHLGTTSTNG